MKILIVNADDFGYSPGVNKGIIEAHKDGIVTSTSVMVDSVAANEAKELLKYPKLSIGLHYVPSNSDTIENQLDHQISKFIQVIGVPPTHIDIHKIKQDDISLKDAVISYAKEHNIRARYSGEAKFIDSFFGPHAKGDVSVNQLIKSIDEATDDINELMCHVGYSDKFLQSHSSYNDLRESELKSICDPRIKKHIESTGITLVNWRQIDN